MPNKPVPNAAEVLPKSLLAKLQRYCSGSIYIPAPQTKAQMNMVRVRSLHNRGWKPAEIAGAVGMSDKQVRHMIRMFADGRASTLRVEYKVCEIVPPEIVEAVQKYICGRIYVPERLSQAARRRSIVQRLLRRGIPVSEVAKRSGLSEHRVRQIRRAELDTAVDRADVKSKKEKPIDRFNVGSVVEPGYVPPKRCSVCGIPIGPSEDECDVCRYKAETRRSADSDVITIHNVPYAIIDRKF